MRVKVFLISILFLLLIANVVALGVTPGRTTLDFEPGLKKTVDFSIINSEKKDMNLVLYAQGELNQSISLNTNSVQMKASEDSKHLSYELVLPTNLSPGIHVAEVVVLQLPEKSTSEAYVGAAIAVVTQVYVFVPYPGKYAEADLNIVNAEQNQDAVFIIPVISRGKMDLASVKANVDIYNKLNEKVATFNTESVSVLSQQRKEIVTKWNANVSVGVYRAVATLIYDGEIISLEKQFSVGNQTLDLQSIEVKDFSLGQIAKFDMLVENKWSEKISSAYAQTQVFDKNQQVIADFKSATYDIDPLTKTVMSSYWDTAGIKAGDYEAKVFLRYGEKSSQKNVQLKVATDSIQVIGLGYVVSSSNTGGSNNNLIIILVVVIAILIIINLLWFMFLRKRVKK